MRYCSPELQGPVSGIMVLVPAMIIDNPDRLSVMMVIKIPADTVIETRFRHTMVEGQSCFVLCKGCVRLVIRDYSTLM